MEVTSKKDSQEPQILVNNMVDEAIGQPTEVERERTERLALLDAMRIMTGTEVPAEEPALSVDGVGFFALCDIHGVKGKQKQGKTSALKVVLAALLGGSQFRIHCELKEPLVLWLDTEQKAADVKLIISDVRQMTGLSDAYIDTHLMLYSLRKMNYETLLDDTRLLIGRHHPQVVIVDGIVEYVASFNDEMLSRQLIHDLLVLCEDEHCAIVNVLHENKAADDYNMRGHLGTVLAQAAGTVLECRKSNKGVITVRCSDPRHGAMPAWSIMFGQDGTLVDADELYRQLQEQRAASQQQQRIRDNEQKMQQRLETCLRIVRDNGGAISRKELTEKMSEELKLKRPTIANFISTQKGSTLFEVDGIIQVSPEMTLAF